MPRYVHCWPSPVGKVAGSARWRRGKVRSSLRDLADRTQRPGSHLPMLRMKAGALCRLKQLRAEE